MKHAPCEAMSRIEQPQCDKSPLSRTVSKAGHQETSEHGFPVHIECGGGDTPARMARTKTPQSLLPGPQSSNRGSMLMEPTPSQRAIICIQYGVVSVSITLFNRAVFSVYQFNFPAFVTLIQILVSILYIYTLKYSGRLRVGALTIEGARRVRG